MHTLYTCLIPYHSMKCIGDLISCTVDGHVLYGILWNHCCMYTCSIYYMFSGTLLKYMYVTISHFFVNPVWEI